MEYKLAICEGCDNIVSMADNKKDLFTCPVCGCLNERSTVKLYEGEITALSPTIQCEMELDKQDKSGMLLLDNLDENLQDALQTLISCGWKLKFKTKKVD
jgi:predicted RNA-binding Zn-ribbon protein involved in translation (DUF1610 family)